MSRSALLLSLFVLSGCASDALEKTGASSTTLGAETSSEADFSQVVLRVNLAPSQLREAGSDDYRVLPQTFRAPTVRNTQTIDLGSLELLRPVHQTGSVVAYQVNPSVAVLPGESVPLAAQISLSQPDSIQSYTFHTDGEGRFDTWAVPAAGYRLGIVPDDPLLPMYTADWEVANNPQPLVLDLGAGVPVYGRISTELGALPGARIHLVDPYGTRSATAVADAYGLYQLRTTPGVWTVVCEGRDTNQDPTLTFSEIEVGEAGANVDIAYPNRLPLAVARVAVEDANGKRLRGAVVRFVAESLDGYDGYDATLSNEVITSESPVPGELVPGRYTVEALPPEQADDLSPKRITGVRFGVGTTTLEPIQLEPLIEVGGAVSGPGGSPVESASVVCEEIGFDGRGWSAFTNARGRFTMELPQVPVECEARPPSHRTQLASMRMTIEPSSEQDISFDLRPGQMVIGKVFTGDDLPEPYVVVDIRDGGGKTLGSGLTGQDGQFEIPIDLESAAR